MSEHIFTKYAQGNPVLCKQLLKLSNELAMKLTWAKNIDDNAGAINTVAVPILGGGGGSNLRLRSTHLPTAIFMKSLLELSCALHPTH